MSQSTVSRVLDSIYLIPAILDHIHNPSKLTAKILRENRISEDDVVVFAKIKSLLEYHYKAIRSNYQTDYPLLRKGLSEYFETYLKDMFIEIDIIDEKYMVLDYGCGDGRISHEFLRYNPESFVIMVDRVMPDFIDKRSKFYEIDFEKNFTWFERWNRYFNCIILSEVLHCKDRKGQNYLIDTSHKMLKKGGLLIISENLDYCMEYRIGKIKKDDKYKVVTIEALEDLTKDKFKLLQTKRIQKHIIYKYQKL